MSKKSDLKKLVSSAKEFLLNYLSHFAPQNIVVTTQLLKPYVISCINTKEKRDGTIQHITKPIHRLAFILAYKELEAEGEIEIERNGVPFPMTANDTLFVLKGGK